MTSAQVAPAPAGSPPATPENDTDTPQPSPPKSLQRQATVVNAKGKPIKASKPVKSTGGGGSFFDVAQRQAENDALPGEDDQRGSLNNGAVSKLSSNASYVGSKNKKWWVIDPRSSTWITYWDAATMVALIFTAFVTPYEVGFLDTERGSWLFWVNRAIDMIFLTDILLQFCMGYSMSAGGGKYWEFDAKAIACHYVSSPWFFLDTFSIGVSGFDIFGDESSTSLSGLKAVRTFRLIKLVRLTRGSRVFKRWEMKFSINYTYLSLSSTCVTILLTCHWFACIWGLQASFNRLNSWLGMKEYCVPMTIETFPAIVPKADVAALLDDCPVHRSRCFVNCNEGGQCEQYAICQEPGTIYAYALYWSVMTATSVGYGDVYATPFNVVEQVVCTVMMLLGGMLWGYLIGTFCGIAAQLSPGVREFRDHLSGLNNFMHAHALPKIMRYKLREYMHQAVHLMHAKRDHDVLQYLSRQMQLEVAWFVHRVWLKRVWYLNSEDVNTRSVLLDLAAKLRAGVYPPGELCDPGHMYIVSRGIALRGVRVYKTGCVWGEDILLAHPHLQKNWPALAMSYLWVYQIDSATLLSVLRLHATAAQRIWALRQRWLVCRGIVRLAELQQEQERQKGEEDKGGFMDALQLLDAERLALKAKKRHAVKGMPSFSDDLKPQPGSSGGREPTGDEVVPIDDPNAPDAQGHGGGSAMSATDGAALREEVSALRKEVRERDAQLSETLRQLSKSVELLTKAMPQAANGGD